MFRREETAPPEVETIIGPSVNVEGDFVAAGNVIVEGSVSGTLKTDKHLRVGNNAKISANVSAGSASISGEIRGNITVKEDLELSATAKIFGDIKTKTIQVATGAIIDGKCAVGQEHQTKSEERAQKTSRGKEWKLADEAVKSRL